MKIVHGADEWAEPLEGAVVSVGNFDGLHRGHQEILRTGGELARKCGGQLVAVTFEPHPLRVVAPDRAPATLTPPQEKLRCLALAGVDATLVLNSEPELLSLEPREFIERIILPRFGPSHMVEGRSFGFGRGRSGNVDTLAQLGLDLGFETVVVPPVQFDVDGKQERISSSLVRRLIAEGRIAAAIQCMGRRYSLFGTVAHGRGRGRELGFPTANLECGDQLIPGEGVYAAIAVLEGAPGTSYAAAVSIGHTPTFEDAGLLVEAHLLDYGGTLSGVAMRLEFLSWVRKQRKFEGPAQLAEQIERDVKQIRSEIANLSKSDAPSAESESA